MGDELDVPCEVTAATCRSFCSAGSKSGVRSSLKETSSGIMQDIYLCYGSYLVKKNGWRLGSAGLSGFYADTLWAQYACHWKHVRKGNVVRENPVHLVVAVVLQLAILVLQYGRRHIVDTDLLRSRLDGEDVGDPPYRFWIKTFHRSGSQNE